MATLVHPLDDIFHDTLAQLVQFLVGRYMNLLAYELISKNILCILLYCQYEEKVFVIFAKNCV